MSSCLRATQYNLFHKSMLLNYEWHPRRLQAALLLLPPSIPPPLLRLRPVAVECKASAEASLTATSALWNAYMLSMAFQIYILLLFYYYAVKSVCWSVRFS